MPEPLQIDFGPDVPPTGDRKEKRDFLQQSFNELQLMAVDVHPMVWKAVAGLLGLAFVGGMAEQLVNGKADLAATMDEMERRLK